MGDAIEEAEDKVKLASVGIDPDDPNALLSEETIRNFKEMHDSLMADVYAGNSEMLNALSELENVNLSSLTGYLSDTQEFMEILAEGVDFENLNNSLGSVMDQFSKVAEAAGIMTGSVVGTTGVSVGKNKRHKRFSLPGLRQWKHIVHRRGCRPGKRKRSHAQ